MRKLRILAIVLLLIVAVSALVAGCLFMVDPGGSKLGLSIAMLRFTSFENFFLPGLVLFTVNGVLALVAAIAIIRRWPYYPVRLCVQGLLLTGWIVIQVILIREFNFLHALMGAAGLFFIGSGIVLLMHPSD